MRDFYLIVNWLVVIALLGLGFVALLKNRSITLNKVFAVFTVTISVWIIASYISNDVKNSVHVSVIGNYVVFLFSYISSILLLWFAIALAEDVKAGNRLRKFMLPILVVAVTTCTPLVVGGVKRQGSVYAVEFGPLIVLYFVGLVVLLAAALIVLHKNIKRTRGDQKAHLNILYKSMIVALPILLITEFILPAITGWFGLTDVGILAMAIPVFGLYYSVVRLKLFNLRLAIVRALAYVLTIAIIGAIYSFVSYYLTTLVTKNYNQATQEALNVVLIIIAISVYPPMIRIFRRLTNRLFYEDAYDSQEFFDEFNRVLVSTLDLEILLHQVTDTIAKYLKAQYCLVGIKDGAEYGRKIVGTQNREFSDKEIEAVRHATPHLHQIVLIADDLPNEHDQLRRLLLKNDVAVLARLTADYHKVEEGLGYIVLGPKKSGNPYNSQDIRVLEAAANELIIAVQNAVRFEEIEHFNETLQQRVEDATKRLSETNAKLKAMDETKDDFIGMASHQLRTPLTSVKGYLSLVLDGDAGKITSQQRRLLGQAFISSQRMVFLIADLLNVSRLKTGKFLIETTPVNLAAIIKDEISQLKETATGRELALEFHEPAHFPTLDLDETKTRQVIMNFLDNAIYYTPSGGHITVVLDEQPKSVELRVIDNGIGVPKEEQHHLFNKFYRAKNAQKARPDGTGLGLFMAKKVIIAQGGAIIFDSHEGEGSTFGFMFPKKPAKITP